MDSQDRRRLWLAAPAIIGVFAIAFRIGAEAHNPLAGVGAGAAFVLLLVGLIAYGRSKATRAVEAFDTTGILELPAGLDFSCLPGDWPTMARETLNAAGADRVPSLPVVLRVDDATIQLTKKQGWGSGRRALQVRTPVASVEAVRVGRAERVLSGSSLTLVYRAGEELRLDTALTVDDTKVVARRIETASRCAPRAPFEGLVVEADPPPLRTSGPRAAGLMMATFVPFALAMIGFSSAPFAGVAALMALFYALWIQLTRPAAAHQRLAYAVGVVALAFGVDAVVAQEPIRIGGMAVAAGIALWMRSLPYPSYNHRER